MNRPGRRAVAWHRGRVRRGLSILLATVVLLVPAFAETGHEPGSPLDPLPPDTGAAGLAETLRRLETTARLLQVDAHPDDEDGGMLTLESRGKGATVTLLTLTRGEGGQNKTGSNLFDELGVLRTLEVLAADRYYGIEQRFSRVADFGYSKNPQETFQKWQGHDVALADIVRVIREFRPDVLVARFSGTERDGHGHHQASAILTKEAFRAAADPNRFPEQIQEGLRPWQAKKLYIGNVCSFLAQSCPEKDYTVKLNTGELDPVLGTSYIQFAVAGLRHQQSQGLSGISLPSGPRYSFYRLVDSVLPPTADRDGHETNFFDGIDTSLPGLAARLGDEEKKVPWLRPALVEMAERLKQAEAARAQDPSAAALPLLAVARSLGLLAAGKGKIQSSALSAAAKADLIEQLVEKEHQAETAENLALNVSLEASVGSPTGTTLPPERDALTVISPGQKFTVQVKLHNGSKHALCVRGVSLGDLSSAGTPQVLMDRRPDTAPIDPGQDYLTELRLTLPANVLDTRPYWHRDNPQEDAINTLDQPRYATLPFTPIPFRVGVEYACTENGPADSPVEISSQVLVHFLDEGGQEQKRILAVAPEFSVMLEPGGLVIPVAGGSSSSVKVEVSSNLDGTPGGKLHLEAPPGWRVEPAELAVRLDHRGESRDYPFQVFPASLKEGRAEIRAVLEAGGKQYREGYSLVTREDLGSFYYYQPAVQRVSMVEVKVPSGLKVGYIMGAGDDIPTVLEQIGMNVTLIPAEKLGGQDLRGFGTMVLGIRAYDTQKDVAANNQKLLDYVASGGTLVVQYNAGTGDFNNGHFTPYPAELSRARVSVEEAPVEILAPADSLLHEPNEITERDFDGWVQERGLYFMDQWDEHFKPDTGLGGSGGVAAEGRPVKGAVWQGHLYLYRVRLLSAVAGGGSRSHPAVCEFAERALKADAVVIF